MKISKEACCPKTVKFRTLESGDVLSAKSQYGGPELRYYMRIGATGGGVTGKTVNIATGKSRNFKQDELVTPVNATVCIEDAT